MKKIAEISMLISVLLLPSYGMAEVLKWTASYQDGTIKVDGSLDESQWQNAITGSSFTVHGTGDPAEKETEAMFLWDGKGLYIGIRAWETDLTPGSRGSTVRDSGIFTNDRVEFFLKKGDAYRHYVVNSLGVQYDALGKDASADWQWSAACVTAGGNRREFEIFIPWEAAGFSAADGEAFQFNIARFAKSNDELSVWQPWFGGFHDAPELFPVMVPGGKCSGNFKVDQNALSKSPACFAFAEKETAADGYELKVILEDGSVFDTGYHEMGESVEIPADLPVGKHFLEYSVYCAGEAVYRHRLCRSVEPQEILPEALPFFAELVQPWFETETEIVVDYVNNAGFSVAAWQITDKDGAIIYSGDESLEWTGKLFLPLPENTGDYKLAIAVEYEPVYFDFTKADAVGEARQWYAVADDGSLWKDRQERIYPIIYYTFGYEDMIFAKEAGADLVIAGSDWWHVVKGPAPDIVKRNLDTLDLAHGLGLPVAIMVCNDFRNGEKDYESLRYNVARMKNHPALAAWYIADEPALYNIDPEVMAKAADIIREIDPIHPVMGCEVKPKRFNDYQGAFDLFGVDPYPGFPGGDLSMVGEFISAMQQGVDADRCQFVILQGFGEPFSGAHPSRDETFNMTFQVMASGLDGICWWAVEHMRKEPEGYKEAAAMINTLKPVLAAGNVETIRQRNIIIGVMPGMIVAVNTAAVPEKAELPFLPDVEVYKQCGSVSLIGTTLELGAQAGAVWVLDTLE